ncbi:LysR substrate-binding domain-containing protein [Virgibacillus xinjiangensis]|uniref:LysR substrate-binding domain-containing protein n=1 Tax=Virgibacillus xinjiangensis TaxID=393090 RepID=A0ABV7CYN2_9BACI
MDQSLVVFKEVADRKSFSRAAEVLHMSQPAVSQYISALEKEYGVRLLERSNKFVQLNKAGEIIYQYAVDILRKYEQMEILVSDLKNQPGGELKIGASYTIGEYLVPLILKRLQDKYPDILPDVMIGNTDTVTRTLEKREIDIALVEGEIDRPKIEVEPFAQDRMFIVVGNRPELIRKQYSPVELEKETWLIREEGSGTRRMAEELFSFLQISPERALTFGSTQSIKEAVEEGMGITFLSELAIKKELQQQRLHRLDMEGLPFRRQFSLIKNEQEFHPKALQVFEDEVRMLGE